jgi:hypothetical protein
MKKYVLDKSRGPDILEELGNLTDEFFLGQPNEKACEEANHLSFLFRAFGMHRCFYVDDWTVRFSNKFEKSLNDYLHDPAEIAATRAIVHKFARFVHAKRPFKYGLPI